MRVKSVEASVTLTIKVKIHGPWDGAISIDDFHKATESACVTKIRDALGAGTSIESIDKIDGFVFTNKD